MSDEDIPPVLANKNYSAPSAFTPENLLREARRQKSVSIEPVPNICLLDPDGDIVRRLNRRDARCFIKDGSVITPTFMCSKRQTYSSA